MFIERLDQRRLRLPRVRVLRQRAVCRSVGGTSTTIEAYERSRSREVGVTENESRPTLGGFERRLNFLSNTTAAI